jgi:hypothetical protein
MVGVSEWQDIELGEPEVGSDPEYAAMVIVRAPLSPQPDENWLTSFNSGPPPGVTYFISSAFPRAEGRFVVFRCAANEADKYFDQAKRWTEGTNRVYRERVIPELERRRKAAQQEAEMRQQAVEEARRRLRGE